MFGGGDPTTAMSDPSCAVPEPLPDRYALGVVDPERVDLGADSLADFLEANARPLPLLKTEIQTNLETGRAR